MASRESRRPTPVRSAPDAPLVITTAILAGLQLAWFWLGGGSLLHKVAGAVLAIVAVWLVLTRSRPESARPMVVMLVIAIAANLVTGALSAEPPIPGRLPLIFIVATCIVVAGGTLLVIRSDRRPGVAMGIVAVLVAPFLVTEVVLSSGPVPLTATPSPIYARPPLPGAGPGYAAMSVVRVAYPDDLGGYLDASSTVDLPWELSVTDTSSVARLTKQSGDSVLRVDIDRAGPISWQIQLRQFPVQVYRGRSYQLSFQARAARRRTVGVQVNLGREPWSPLGLAQSFPVDTFWQRFSRTFVATGTDSAAWLRFDLGGSSDAVEFRDVLLYDQAGTRDGGTSTLSYTLPYHFDSLGCRGMARPVAMGNGSVRILTLGDSYTLGAGVRDEDAWPARLETMLNSGAEGGQRVQVFNCAVTGAGTANARERFQSLAAAFVPDVVLLGLVLGDDRRSGDDVTMPVLTAGRLDHLLRSLHWWRHRSAEQAFYAASVAAIPTIEREVGVLDSVVRAAGSRLAVLLLQDQASRAWNALAEAIADSRQLRPALPVLPLGDRIRVFAESDRYVDPPLDLHLSRTAHRTIAEAALAFVNQHGLLAPEADSARAGTVNPPARR